MILSIIPRASRLPRPAWPARSPGCLGRVQPATAEWHRRDPRHRGNPAFCTFPAVWLIDGQPYCSRHGGALALLILSGEKL